MLMSTGWGCRWRLARFVDSMSFQKAFAFLVITNGLLIGVSDLTQQAFVIIDVYTLLAEALTRSLALQRMLTHWLTGWLAH